MAPGTVVILTLSDLWLPFPGGAERYAFNLSRELLRAGHEVVALTAYHRPQRFDGPPVITRDIGVFDRHGDGLLTLGHAINELEPDLYLIHGLFAYEFEELWAKVRHPVVQFVHNTRRLDCATVAVYSSHATRDALDDARDGDLTVHPPAYAEDLHVNRDDDYIGFVKPYPHKGAALVYQIAHHMPDRRFLVLRGEWPTLELLPEAPLPNVEFMDPVDDMRDFYRRCQIVLMPSESEDAGTVAQECAHAGIPCIASHVGGLTEVVGGVLMRSRKPLWWVHIIRGLLASPWQYERIVNQQRAFQSGGRQDCELAEFVRTVEALL
jgi:glycosyltransferase involved in cell wall biosynthesis